MATVNDRAAGPAGLNDDIGEEKRLELYRTQVRHPRGRAARLRPVPAEPGQGHQPSVARPGGGRGRLCRRHAARRPLLLHLSRPCPYAGARRAGREGAGRADAARQRPDARQGRLDAPDLGRARRHGLLRHHRRASADRLRRRLARAVQGRQGRLGLLLRRRHHQYRRLPRGAEFRRGLEAAGGLRLREQSLHGIHADRRRDRGAASGRRPRRVLRARAHRHRRQRRRRGLSHRAGGLCQGARRQGAVADRMHDLPPQRPFARRPGEISPRGELEDWKKRDPIKIYRERLLQFGVAEDAIADIDDAKCARSSTTRPRPARRRRRRRPRSSTTDVYADGGWAWRN